ncbi:hypothetical protein Bca52824_045342 [Brassica carinata]|uniref:Uncharacterized protein n=1 Tax=Brassica carinata TaxID=52824 RepID=A0A8X7RF60_BRACI|nr:hypothetical protein Bca52824_045342 [Brassica carinata]
MARRLTYDEKGKGVAQTSEPLRSGRILIPEVDTTEMIQKHELTLQIWGKDFSSFNLRMQRIWLLFSRKDLTILPNGWLSSKNGNLQCLHPFHLKSHFGYGYTESLSTSGGKIS